MLLRSQTVYTLGVRSLANASRARQFNDLNPPVKQIWQPRSVVRGHAWPCVVVRGGRAWSCAVVHGRSCVVVRGPSCVVVRGRARSYVVVRGRAWSCVVVNHCRSAASRPALQWHETTHGLTDAQHIITP